jgi:asparagine N-glycosylation enzyme membrane subunit Stt3
MRLMRLVIYTSLVATLALLVAMSAVAQSAMVKVQLLPAGVIFNAFNATPCNNSSCEKASTVSELEVVSQTFASWNQIGECLRRLDAVRRTA